MRKPISQNVESVRHLPEPNKSLNPAGIIGDRRDSKGHLGDTAPGTNFPGPSANEQKVMNEELVRERDERIFQLENSIYNLRHENAMLHQEIRTRVNMNLVRSHEITIHKREIHLLKEQLANKFVELDSLREKQKQQEKQVNQNLVQGRRFGGWF